MPKMNMTELGIKRLDFAKALRSETFAHLTPEQRAKMRQFDMFDEGGVPGLFLRISSGGAKSWRVVYYPKGQRGRARTQGLKRYPIYSLAKAREEAKRFLANPEDALREQLHDTFQTLWDDYLKRQIIARGLRSRLQVERMIKRHVLPVWKHRRVIDIKRSDVKHLLDRVADKSTLKQSDAVLTVIRKVLHYFEVDQDTYKSPIIKGMTRSKKTSRERMLSDEEIRVFWHVTDSMPKAGALMRLALLTAARRHKLATLLWTDIVDGVWIIRREDDQEKPNAKLITLPKLALDIINAQPRSSKYVFPAGRGPGPYNGFASSFAELQRRMRVELPDMQPFVLHDLRRTARSLMSRIGVQREIAERCLGHTVGSVVEQAYDRHRYEAEKTKAFDALATLIMTILHPATNVVSLRG